VDDVTVGVPQSSVAVALPNAASIVDDDGLQPRAKLFPVALSVGTVTSAVQVAVLDVVDVLPQASVAVNVLVCERRHPLLCMLPSDEVTVGVPQASLAVALPSAPFMVAVDGLQPRAKVLPFAVIVGPVTSAVHVAVRVVVAVLPQPSVAVKVRICERRHPLLRTDPSLDDTVGVPHASVAVALPRAASIVDDDGLQPRARPLPVAVTDGAVTSAVHVAVRDVVDVLAQASVAVNVLVCERRHPLD